MSLSDEQVFQFMIQENEHTHSKFQLHYDAVEKSIRTYLLIIAAIISLVGVLYEYKDKAFGGFFGLDGIQSGLLFILGIYGMITFFQVIEHRMLIISYVKCLNMNRKWFVDNSREKDVLNQKYLFFKVGHQYPKYYVKDRHFYWEALGLAFICSMFLALATINFFINFLNCNSRYAAFINVIWCVLMVILLCALLVCHYRRQAKKKESELTARFPEDSHPQVDALEN